MKALLLAVLLTASTGALTAAVTASPPPTAQCTVQCTAVAAASAASTPASAFTQATPVPMAYACTARTLARTTAVAVTDTCYGCDAFAEDSTLFADDLKPKKPVKPTRPVEGGGGASNHWFYD